MNLLGLEINRNVRLRPRNEGKLKSYESCSDVRAWSHDSRARDTYLREWIKRDMPICVLPCATLANFLRTMTCRSRAKTAPRCHPDCKSKVILESICTSCHAIKECLKDDPSFDKYFAEEEFETIHWPCDKCLDVLKSIKMFWKIIVERIFGVNIPKDENFDKIQDSRTDTVKSVAKLWEKEITQQTLFFKNMTPWLRRGPNTKTESPWKQAFPKREMPTRIPRPCKTDNKDSFPISKNKSPTNSVLTQKARASDVDRSSSSTSKNCEKTSRKVHRSTSVRLRMVDAACDTCKLGKENEELKSYKKNVEVLQQKCNTQESEIEKLKRENNSLKIELQNFYKTCSWKSVLSPSTGPNYDKTAVVPKPFESCIDEGGAPSVIKNTDSEMIITMKNCRNESYRHVSLLQVLHKTNAPIVEVEHINAPGSKKENPIELLTKVQSTFGEIVRREIMLVNNKRFSTKHTDIDATYSKLKNTQSAPSCSTICSETASSESNFVTG